MSGSITELFTRQATTHNLLSLAIFRICFGILSAVMFIDLLANGGIEHYFITPAFHFKYLFLEWVPVPGKNVVYLITTLLILCSVCISAGVLYRLSCFVFFVLFGLLLFSEYSFFKHHYYLVFLLSILFLFTNTNSILSLSASKNTMPFYQLMVFRIQMVIPYFFGGISKLFNPEWTNGSTTKAILISKNLSNTQLLDALNMVMTWGGLCFDLLIAFLLFNRKTRLIGFVLAISFNLSNFFVFNIDIFPLLMISSLVLFIDRFPEKIVSRFKTEVKNTSTEKKVFTKYILIVFLGVQLFISLRHFFIKGSVYQTGEGYNGGWHMIDALKKNEIIFKVKDIENKIEYEVRAEDYFTRRQISAMGRFPELLPQAAAFLKTKAAFWNVKEPQISAKVTVASNFNKAIPVIREDIDLCSVSNKFLEHNEWIYPDKELAEKSQIKEESN